MASSVQKILVDSDCPKFAMTVTKCVKKNDVVGTVTFDLIGLLPTNHIINIIITIVYQSLCGNV